MQTTHRGPKLSGRAGVSSTYSPYRPHLKQAERNEFYGKSPNKLRKVPAFRHYWEISWAETAGLFRALEFCGAAATLTLNSDQTTTENREVNTMQTLEQLRVNVLRNALYHTARRRGLERTNRVFNFVIILAGTAVVSQIATDLPNGDVIAGVVVSTIGALQLVFDFGRQARDHQQLQREYYYLLADIEREESPDNKMLAEWQARQMQITADEPPTLRAIDAKAYNDAIDATEAFDEGERLIVPLTHRVLGAFIPFDGHRYRKLSENRKGSRDPIT